MNMFRNLLALALIAFGLGLMFGGPEEWKWPDLGGAYVVQAISLCIDFRPWSYILCFVLAIALFMTRKIY
ncbi:MAG TPA: hypothetical protein VGC39_01635 [Candidatus Methylacidiphilales bacterium]